MGHSKIYTNFFMILFYFPLGILVFYSGSFAESLETPKNELPMYGEEPFSDEGERINKDFIEKLVSLAGGDRGKAFEGAIEAGWNYFFDKDYPQAMRRFNQAWLIDPNNPKVFHGYGTTLGYMGKADQYVKWNQKAAEMGWGNAQINMGWAYLIGFGVEENPQEAFRWYRMLAHQNHPTGLNVLGLLYDWGYGVEQNVKKAKLLYKKADEKGFAGGWIEFRRKNFQQLNPEDKNISFQQILDKLREEFLKEISYKSDGDVR